MFVFFVDFVVPTPEVTVAYLLSFHNQVNEPGMRPSRIKKSCALYIKAANTYNSTPYKKRRK
jgi:hypothetical protein